jgi:aminoglycoside phosphotransferase (APT) family kinase protein
MKPSTYLEALVRAHVAVNPPLAVRELAALKGSVIVLATLGRLLAQVRTVPGVTREDLQRTRSAVADLEQHTHELARVALVSWETRND